MSAEKVIRVPTIFEGAEQERDFRETLAGCLRSGQSVLLDFQAHPAVSSPILGHIMYHLVAENRSRVGFINVSNYMLETLRTIMGESALELVRDGIKDLDDSETLERF